MQTCCLSATARSASWIVSVVAPVPPLAPQIASILPIRVGMTPVLAGSKWRRIVRDHSAADPMRLCSSAWLDSVETTPRAPASIAEP